MKKVKCDICGVWYEAADGCVFDICDTCRATLEEDMVEVGDSNGVS